MLIYVTKCCKPSTRGNTVIQRFWGQDGHRSGSLDKEVNFRMMWRGMVENIQPHMHGHRSTPEYMCAYT